MKEITLNEQITDGGRLENIGAGVIRYGLAIVLLWIGILKFTPYEAEGIKPLVEHSPLLAWVYGISSVTGFSKIIGTVEIISGILIAFRNFSIKASLTGSILAIITFIITLTFLLSTPGIIQPDYSFPFISPQPGQFLLKDIVLLGAALWLAGEALRASKTNITVK